MPVTPELAELPKVSALRTIGGSSLTSSGITSSDVAKIYFRWKLKTNHHLLEAFVRMEAFFAMSCCSFHKVFGFRAEGKSLKTCG
jgi:hypothetical protein